MATGSKIVIWLVFAKLTWILLGDEVYFLAGPVILGYKGHNWKLIG